MTVKVGVLVASFSRSSRSASPVKDVERGRAAVWQHAGEAGLQDFLRLVASHFDIDDIAIHTPGKLTYLKEQPRPPKYRIRPFESDVRLDVATGRLLKK